MWSASYVLESAFNVRFTFYAHHHWSRPFNFLWSSPAVQLFSCSKKARIVQIIACENIRFSSLFADGDVTRETFPAAKSEKRMFSQAIQISDTSMKLSQITKG